MQVSKINLEQTYNKAKEGVRTLGESATNILRTANGKFDTFISSKNMDPKVVKQVGVGAIVGIAGLTIVISCIKSIVDSIKEKVNEK